MPTALDASVPYANVMERHAALARLSEEWRSCRVETYISKGAIMGYRLQRVVEL